MKHFLLLIIAVLAGTVLADIPFVTNGCSQGSYIVLDQSPTPAAQTAANELASYLEKISGAPIFFEINAGKANRNIVVGYGALAQRAGLTLDGVKHDGFRLVTKENTLYIYGRDRPVSHPVISGLQHMHRMHTYNARYGISAFGDSGTLHGVYYFLREYLGVRWFMPGPLGEVCPQSDTVAIPELDLTVNPDFEFRVAYPCLFNYNPDFAVWYRRAGFGAPYPIEVNESFFKPEGYLAAHPEWYALKNGSRVPLKNSMGHNDLCLSQPSLIDAIVEDACRYFDEDSERMSYCISRFDWATTICDCDDCQKMAVADNDDAETMFSNYLASFANLTAVKLRERKPDKYIGFIAGTNLVAPDRVILEPNVAVMMTKSHSRRYEDFTRKRNDETALAWAEHCPCFYTWDGYTFDLLSPHLSGLPILFSQWLEDDVRRMKGRSKGTYLYGSLLPPFYQFANAAQMSLTYYLAGRLLWNAELDVQNLLEDYYQSFFGPAASDMRAYWTLAEKLWCNMEVKQRGAADGVEKTLYTKEALNMLMNHLDNGLKQTEPQSVYARRIEAIRELFMKYWETAHNMNSECPVLELTKFEREPVIDGIREEIWEDAPALSLVHNLTGGRTAAETTARLLVDSENLFIFVNCGEANMQHVVAECEQNDSGDAPCIWDDDAIEIFISPDSTTPFRDIQIILNSKGVYLDGCHNYKAYPPDRMRDFNISGLVVKAGRDAEGWTLELSIPLKSLDVEGAGITSEWRMNICRDHWIQKKGFRIVEPSSWSPTGQTAWNIQNRFGYVRFK